MKGEVQSLKGERRSDLPERSFEFARRLVLLCRALDEKPGAGRTLANQLLRSGTSVGANIEEEGKLADLSDDCSQLIAILTTIIKKVKDKKCEVQSLKSEKFQTSNFPLQTSTGGIQQ